MEKIKVALAEDHTMVRKGFVAMLTQGDEFDVVGDVGDGNKLLELIKILKIKPDVCLLDINMPILNGYDTLKVLRKEYPDMKFIILSQVDHEFSVIKALKLGANGYLLKDSDPSELKEALRTVCRQPYFYSSLVNGTLINIVQKGEEYTRLSLTDIEQEFLKHCCSDMNYLEIGEKMNLSKRTIEGYREAMFIRLGVKSRAGLAMYAVKLGLVQTGDDGM